MAVTSSRSCGQVVPASFIHGHAVIHETHPFARGSLALVLRLCRLSRHQQFSHGCTNRAAGRGESIDVPECRQYAGSCCEFCSAAGTNRYQPAAKLAKAGDVPFHAPGITRVFLRVLRAAGLMIRMIRTYSAITPFRQKSVTLQSSN